jgi:chromosome segregation ATPase
METVDRLTQEVKELNRVQKDLRFTLNYRDKEKDEFIEAIEEQVKEISTLKKILKDAEKERSSHLTGLRKAGTTIIGLEGQLIDQDKIIAEQKKQIADAETQSSEKSFIMEQQKNVLFDTAIKPSDKAQKDLETIEKGLIAKDEKIKELTQIIYGLNTQIERLSASITHKDFAIDRYVDEIKGLSEAFKISTGDIHLKTKELTDCKQTIREQEALIIQMKGCLGDPRIETDNKEKQLAEAKIIIKRFQKTVGEYQECFEIKDSYIAELGEQIRQKNKLISDLRQDKEDQIRYCQARQATDKKTIEEQKQYIDDKDKKIKEKDLIFEEAALQLSKQSETIESQKKEIKGHKKEIKEKTQIIYDGKNANRQVTDELNRHKRIMTDKIKECEELQRICTNVKYSLEERSKELDQKTGVIKQLNAKIEQQRVKATGLYNPTGDTK